MNWSAGIVFILWTFARIAAVHVTLHPTDKTQISNEQNEEWKGLENGFSLDSVSESLHSIENSIPTIPAPEGMEHEKRMKSSTKSIPTYLKNNLEVFSPEKLNVFLNENEKNVTDVCREKLFRYLMGLRQNRTWAVKILDATGSYSFTFLFGNEYWLGSQTACLDFLHSANAIDSPPFPVAFYSAKYQITLNISSMESVRPITVGLCLPSDCQESDLTLMLKQMAPLAATLKAVRGVPNRNYNIFLEPFGIILGLVTFLGLLMVVTGTMLDIQSQRKHVNSFNQKNKEIGQNKLSVKISTVEKLRFYVNHHVEGDRKGSNLGLVDSTNSINSSTSTASVSSFDSTEEKKGMFTQILLCFSFKRNFEKICSSKTTDSLTCVHGLRVFSLLWVIAGHSCMITMPFVDNKSFRAIVERDFLFQSISNGAFSVDTFFFISGLLISYVFYKSEIEKNPGKEEKGSTLARNLILKFLGGATYRVIRLTPPYIVVLILTYLTGRWFYFNSVFDPPVGDHFTCQQYWWRNLLYINTLFPVDQMCMIWSWYLADDTQFYFLGLMILLISSRYVKTATVLTSLLMISSWITTTVITLHTQHKPSIEEPLGLFDQLYDKPWTRLGPYVTGMMVGIYLAKIKCKATYHKGLVIFFWIVSMLTTFVLVHGLYGELGQVESAAYVALSHTAWALAISWVIIACVTGYGGPVNAILSLKMFAPLSRLTYCAYLIHPLIMLSAMAHMDGPIHLQRDTMIIAIFGYFFASYLASIVLTIVFEAPAVALLNKFHPLKKKMK